MTSKLSQRCHIFLIVAAILSLLVIIVLVWTLYGNTNPTKGTKMKKYGGNSTEPPEIVIEKDSSINEKKETKEENITLNVEFIKLFKFGPLPLHDHDILYDQKHNNTIGELVIRHSGHYRHKSAEIWDPHPEYKIKVFGRDIHMQLFHNAESVAHPDLHVTHFLENVTQKVRHDSKMSDCFYNGKVKNDPNSAIAVSLCHGMLGYIHTTHGNFYIEPYEEFFNSSTPLLHKVTKITDEDTVNIDDCETTDEIDDELHIHDHYRNKREIYFDYVEETEFKRKKTKENLRRNHGGNVIRKKRTGREYFIELLIVADKTMLEYHKNKDNLVHYVLTLMSHVSFLFKEATIGNPISLTIVKIFIDTVTEYKDLFSNQRLASFCKWQKNNSLIGVHHDAALLLTRTPICGNKEKLSCHTLGIAEVGGMCSESSSCALAKDNGLSTSYTIAHEIGHLLNMVHDETHHCVSVPGGPHKGIMTKSLTNGSTPWKWSSCSNHFLTEFLDSPRSSCLLRRSSTNHIRQKLNTSLPGEYYEVDKQCELGFGPGSTLCAYNMPTDICKVLWCTNHDGGCQTQHMPWADGTKCGDESWCHNRECVTKDLNSLTPINGLWGPWKGWGECSRTCGGGITISKRYCDSPPPANGGTYCLGENTKYMSCNVQDCPKNTPDFREVQCSEFNGNTKGIQGVPDDVEWIPKYGINYHTDNCKLTCRVKGTSQYFPLKSKVVDGTKCSLNSFGICVNGVCKPGGCDNKLNSKMQLDECGICNGDNSTCQEIKGNYNYSNIANDDTKGYVKIVRIPSGSFNIYIEQIAFRNNTKNDSYIALADGQTGKYLINQDYTISSFPKDIYYGGIKLSYSGSENIRETVKSQRHQKLQQDLIVAVLNIYGHPPNIMYKYTIDKEIAPKYGWHLYETNWTECSNFCDGQQSMVPICVNLDNGYHVDPKFCSHLNFNHLKRERTCNTHCELIWKISHEGLCSSNCGEGIREIHYDCFIIEKNYDREKPIDKNYCQNIPKPRRFEKCYGSCESTRWIYENWSRCSKTCGGGTKSRTARCVDVNNNTLSDSLCESEEKIVVESCNMENCPHWKYGEWTQCSAPCGKGTRMRSYHCTRNNQIVAPMSCNTNDLDTVQEQCEITSCHWHIGIWSSCSVTCGEGIQIRDVSCRVHDRKIKENYCDYLLKPETTKRCETIQCDKHTTYRVDNNEILDDYYYGFRWDLGPWSKCSKSCDGGIQSRQVVCRDSNGITDEYMCEMASRPNEHKRCNEFNCPKWIYGEFGRCEENCEKHRQVKCVNHEGKLVPTTECDLATKPESTGKCQCENPDVHRKKNIPFSDKRLSKNYKWQKMSWGQCSSDCGKGTQIRKVSCRDVHRDVAVVDSYCSTTRKPKHIRSCEFYDKFTCNYTWNEGPWSKCSKLCNEGVKHRNVTCRKVLPGGVLQNFGVNPENCNQSTKPKLQEKCTERKCDDKFKWVSGNWTKCTESCGKKGFQTRKLSCLNMKGQRVQPRHCPKMFKPMRKRKCNRHPCSYSSCKEIKEKLNNSTNADYHLNINGKLAVVYCYKMDTKHPEEYITLHPSRRNYAEFFDKRLNRPDTCIRYSDPDNCDCASINTDLVGYSEFWKVRINITNMRIIVDDFTFSRTNLNRQKYGHAGDCYSEVEDCIEGSFSVDLTGTSFKISDVVTWYTHGNNARRHIHKRDDQHVHGRCGGNCGSCLPDPRYGLIVEVT